jgi:hypothetical protein
MDCHISRGRDMFETSPFLPPALFHKLLADTTSEYSSAKKVINCSSDISISNSIKSLAGESFLIVKGVMFMSLKAIGEFNAL